MAVAGHREVQLVVGRSRRAVEDFGVDGIDQRALAQRLRVAFGRKTDRTLDSAYT